VHLILHNYDTHNTAADPPLAYQRPPFHVHFTPMSAFWLNLVERSFTSLTEQELQCRVHRSTQAFRRPSNFTSPI
jgi:hypothetical protein